MLQSQLERSSSPCPWDHHRQIPKKCADIYGAVLPQELRLDIVGAKPWAVSVVLSPLCNAQPCSAFTFVVFSIQLGCCILFTFTVVNVALWLFPLPLPVLLPFHLFEEGRWHSECRAELITNP